jgi:hypothetical protein
MAVQHKKVSVVIEVSARDVSVRLADAHGQFLEDERFTLRQTEADLDPGKAAKDLFDLLYQCAGAAVHDQEW